MGVPYGLYGIIRGRKGVSEFRVSNIGARKG